MGGRGESLDQGSLIGKENYHSLADGLNECVSSVKSSCSKQNFIHEILNYDTMEPLIINPPSKKILAVIYSYVVPLHTPFNLIICTSQ